jgi:MmgE/PrpD N-terminal domain
MHSPDLMAKKFVLSIDRRFPTLPILGRLYAQVSKTRGKLPSPFSSSQHIMSPKTNGTSPSIEQRTANLIQWTSSLNFSDIPASAITRTKSFLLDTIACSIAGHSHPAVRSLLSFAEKMGPKDGSCEYFFDPERRTSAAFAALVNGAACHVVELDDLNNAGMIHPVHHLSLITNRRQLWYFQLLLPLRRMWVVLERNF